MKISETTPDKISADEARARLKVSAQTLYAYVSRGHIRAFQHPQDARKSLYLKEDVERWAERKARGRSRQSVAASALRWGEPSLISDITTIHNGRFSYRGRDAVDVSRRATLEDLATLLLDRELAEPPPDMLPLLAAPSPMQRMLMALARKVSNPDAPPLGLLQTLVSAVTRRRSERSVHLQLAEAWELTAVEAEVLRQVLVLCGDHELNASTFACRVTASTGACLPACLLSGLSSLSGPRHGGMVNRALDFMAAAVNGGALPAKAPPGFGHPLYPSGDPRAAEILRVLPLGRDWQGPVDLLAQRGIHPSVDLALAHVQTALGLPRDGGVTLFALGRSVGWMAHAEEQARSGEIIRPRARQNVKS